ncbi:UNVERIFIED_CONTAM: Receptor-type tyrosine-protein phosphatase eta [Trichonephila clavipes]
MHIKNVVCNQTLGYSSLREYIATQGPLANTVDDLWRMIWEQSVSMIVMLTQCVERGKNKCEQYWPDAGEAKHYGDMQVRTISESMLSSYIIRLFHVQLLRPLYSGSTRISEVYNLEVGLLIFYDNRGEQF